MLTTCFPGGSAGKEGACNAEDLGSIPGLGRSPGEGKGYSLQHSGLENSMDCTVHRVAKSQTQLSDFHSRLYLNVSGRQKRKDRNCFGELMFLEVLVRSKRFRV